MKHLKKHWSAQPLSFVLSLLIALPVLSLLLLRINAAHAQNETPQPVWAVLDFANPSGYGSNDVGRLASDSFVVQLAKLNRYRVLPRAQLLSGIQDENLTPPLNLTSIERLGQSLGVNAIVAGEISAISFSRDRRQAKVSIAVRVIDPKSGFLLNGALAEGVSNVRPIAAGDEEQLVDEAFGNAAYNAVKQLSKFDLPVATVLISGNNTLNGHNVTVTINKGTRDGIYPGLDMLVSRGGRYVGTIRVAEPTDNDANAEITDLGLGIEPGDRATAIFHMPSYTVDKTTGSYQTATGGDLTADAPTTSRHSSPLKGIGGVVLAVLSAALLLTAIRAGHTSGDNSLGGANVSSVSAIEGRTTSVNGGTTVIPTGLSFALGYRPVAVRITADIGNIDSTNFLEFHVYRSDSPAALSSAANLVAAGVGTVTTTSAGNGGGQNVNTGGGQNVNTGGGGQNTNGTTTGLLGINGFGPVPLFAEAAKRLEVFDDYTLKTAVTASKPDPSDSTTLVELSVSTDAVTTTTTGISAAYLNGIPGTGLGFGQRVSYTIEGLYIQPSTFSSGTINPGTGTTSGNTNTNTNTNTNGGTTNGGTTNGATGGTTNTSGGNQNTNTNTNTSGTTTTGHSETFQLTGQRTTNSVTYIVPVAPNGTSVTSTGSANVNVTVPATAGANDYILQISADPSFQSNTRTYKAAAGAYNVPNPQTNPNQEGSTSGTISVAAGTAVVFNNINLNTDFPGSTSLFYRVGARNSADNGAYIYSDPLSLGLTGQGLGLRSSIIDSKIFKAHRGRY